MARKNNKPQSRRRQEGSAAPQSYEWNGIKGIPKLMLVDNGPAFSCTLNIERTK